MAVDRGGLDYPITVRDGFSSALTKFVQGTNAARKSWDAFRKSMSAGSDGRLAASLERVNRATGTAERNTRRLTRAQQQRRAAVARLRREEDKQAITQRESVAAGRRNLQVQRRLESQETARLRAARRLSKTLNRIREEEALLAEIQERRAAILGSKVSPRNRRLLRELEQLEQRTRKLTQEEKEFQRVVNRQASARRRADSVERQQRVGEARAAERIARDAERKAEIEALRRAGRIDLVPPGQRGEEVPAFLERIKRSLRGVGERANRVSFTFRRLFGILAAFALARRGIEAFAGAIRSLVQASALLETTEIGIAAVITAVSDVATAQGVVADAGERLALAQQEARRQTELLKLDALETTATFEELAETFQVGLAPGLQAGLDIDQVRQFTKQISLAAQAIGLEQRQLAEEIRSILGGTINPRTTRIAAALGITNEDIRTARRTGNLFDFLQDRFGAFNEAADEAANTFTGLVNRVRGGFRLLLAQGGVVFFEELKDTLRTTLNTLLQVDAVTGQLTFNPEFLELVEALSEGLAGVVREFRGFGDGIGLGAALTVIQSVSAALEVAAGAAVAFGEGIIIGLQTLIGLGRLVGSVIEPIARVFGISTGDLQAIIRLFGALLTTIIGVQIAFSAIRLLMNPIVTGAILLVKEWKNIARAVRNVNLSLKLTRASTLKILLPILIILGAVGGIITLLGKAEEAVESISDLVASIAGPVIAAVDSAVDKAIDKAEEYGASFGTTADEVEKAAEQVRSLRDETEKLAATGSPFSFLLSGVVEGVPSGGISQIVRSLFDPINEASGNTVNLVSQINELERVLDDLVRRREDLEALSDSVGLSVDQAETLNTIRSQIVLTVSNITAAEERLNEVRAAAFDLGLERLNQELEQSGLVLERELAERRIVAQSERAAAVAALSGRRAQERLVAAQNELIAFRQQAEVKESELEAERRLLEIQLATLNAERSQLSTLIQSGEATTLQQERWSQVVGLIEQLLPLYNQQVNLLNDTAEANAAVTEQLERQRALMEFADAQPIAAGIVEGFAQAFEQATDLFENFKGIFASGVQGLAGTISNYITDAFDPSKDQNFFADFGQFLQNFAQSILQTLLEIAISAIALNLLSGGLLGPLVAGFANTALGRHEGGEVPKGYNKGGRIRSTKGRVHGAHRRARGFNKGGIPNEPARNRPKGLHPADTVPIWAQPGEWVIRVASVAKAGSDAIQRVNEGLFDPAALRAAVGLAGNPVRRMRAGTGPGFRTGGGVPSSVPVASGGSGASGPSMAVIAPTKEAAARLLSSPGGQSALLDAIGQLRHNGQLGGV